MATYTVQIRTIVEDGVKIFDFDYPIFDPAYKGVLETKIIDYFYFREIGLETVGQFKQFLKSKMNRIMPYYNKLYLADQVFATYDPYKNKDVTTEDNRTSTSDSQSSSNNTDKFSDTPQGLNNGSDYLTSMTAGDTDSSGSVTTTDQYVQHIHGHDGMKYPTDILVGLRATFLNIDQMVIEELHDLFLNIY